MADQPNFQIPPLGFGSYLQDILPEDVAIAAGAFAALVSFRIQLDPFSVWSIRTRAFPFLAQHPGVSQLLYRIG